VLREDLDRRDYSVFIKLNTQRLPNHAQDLSHDYLELAAAAEVEGGGSPSVAELMNAAATRTSELYSDTNFVFSDAWTLKIDVDVSARISSAAHLMICADFEQNDDGYAVAYDNCQLKTALMAGRYVGNLRMTSSNSTLLVSVMRLDAPEEMEQLIWVRGTSGDVLTIR
jgi:hypothetical protein